MMNPRIPLAPLQVEWEITFRCNQKCLFCFNADHKFDGELDFENIKVIIDKLDKNHVFNIALTGGEPFMHPEIDTILEYLSHKKIRVTILSNGTLIPKNLIQFISSYKSRFALQLSIEGIKDTHDHIVGLKGAYDKVMETIKILKRYQPRYYPATTLTSLNYKEIPSIYDLFLKMNMKNWRIVTLVPSGAALVNDLNLSLDEYRWVYSQLLRKLNESSHMKLEIRCPSGLPLIDHFPKKEDERIQWVGCCGSILFFQIAPNGDVYPCSLLRKEQFLAGNLVQMPLNEIWNSPAMKFLRDNFYTVSGKCTDCHYTHVCRGGCKALSQEICGDFRAPDPRCLYEPSTGLTLPEFFQEKEKEVINS